MGHILATSNAGRRVAVMRVAVYAACVRSSTTNRVRSSPGRLIDSCIDLMISEIEYFFSHGCNIALAG